MGTDGAAGAWTGCRCPPLTPGKLSSTARSPRHNALVG
jgi:hypothetical protein